MYDAPFFLFHFDGCQFTVASIINMAKSATCIPIHSQFCFPAVVYCCFYFFHTPESSECDRCNFYLIKNTFVSFHYSTQIHRKTGCPYAEEWRTTGSCPWCICPRATSCGLLSRHTSNPDKPETTWATSTEASRANRGTVHTHSILYRMLEVLLCFVVLDASITGWECPFCCHSIILILFILLEWMYRKKQRFRISE